MSRSDDRFSGKYLKYTSVGFEFGGAVLIFALIGYFLDQRWGTYPWVFIAGVLTGIAVGTYMLIKTALMINNEEDRPGE